MQPLSRRTRRAYFIVLFAIFVSGIVPLALYANGWRFHAADGFVRTGGVFLRLSSTGVIAVIGEKTETNNLLQRNVFVQNLPPGEHEIAVYKEGHHAWQKRLPVMSQKVTEAHPFLVPAEPVRVVIPKLLPVDETATGTPQKPLPHPDYDMVVKLFAPPVIASTTADVVTAPARLSLEVEGKLLLAIWRGTPDSAPFYFCTTGACVATTTLSFKENIVRAEFYPNEQDFVLVTLPSGVYAAELDTRGGAIVIPLVETRGVDFRIGQNSRVYLKEGNEYSELVLQ